MKFDHRGLKKNNDKKTFSQSKKGRIIVRNIPFTLTEKSLKNHFAKFGGIKEVNLLRRTDGNSAGCAFVEFNTQDEATNAIENCSGKEFMGRTITAALALERSRYIASRPDADYEAKQDTCPNAEQSHDEEGMEDGDTEVKDECPDLKAENQVGDAAFVPLEDDFEVVPRQDASRSTEGKKQKAAQRKKAQSLRKGRVIVRNVSFKATEVNMKKHFSQFGELKEVKLLRKPDGKLVGCGFVQFVDKRNAAKAIVECSGKPFLGRPIVLDWALPKTKYTEMNPSQTAVEVKDEPESDDDIKRKEEEYETKYKPDPDVKLEESSDEEEHSEDDEETEEEEDEEEEEGDEEEDVKDAVTNKPQKFVSNDVSEGKTVFVKNIPFAANSEQFRACMEQFGDVEYALVCYDRLTEHSKGTGFVKYKTLESAQTCLSAGTELTLLGQVLDCHKAINRDALQAKDKGTENTASKDSRNLYLVKEGVVLAGSKAAANVSVTDMAKRLQLEQLKTQMLRNLNMFISDNRLVVHNLPPSYDDAKLFQLFKKHSTPGATVTESKVMRDLVNVDEHGVGSSKEIGFVRFTKHEDALLALRNINNNPNIFTASKRPIVSFAIENRMIHKVRQRREQKSRDNNPLFKNKVTEVKKKVAEGGGKDAQKLKLNSRRNRRRALSKMRKKLATNPTQNGKSAGTETPPNSKLPAQKPTSKKDARKSKKSPKSKGEPKQTPQRKEGDAKVEYAGVAAERGDVKFRTKHNLKAQASLHVQTVRKDLKKKKANKKVQEQQKIQREQIRQPKQKKGRGKAQLAISEEKSFGELVNKYKSKMTVPLKQKKWYEPDK